MAVAQNILAGIVGQDYIRTYAVTRRMNSTASMENQLKLVPDGLETVSPCGDFATGFYVSREFMRGAN